MHKINKTSKKGQLFSTDLSLSAIIFLIVFVLFLSLWNVYSLQLQENTLYEEMGLLAFQTVDVLVSTPGVPNQWESAPALNASQIYALGLAEKDRTLSSKKVNKLFALSYDEMKTLLNLERFEVLFALTYMNGSTINQTGISPSNQSRQVISVQRTVLDESGPRRVQFTLWRE